MITEAEAAALAEESNHGVKLEGMSVQRLLVLACDALNRAVALDKEQQIAEGTQTPHDVIAWRLAANMVAYVAHRAGIGPGAVTLLYHYMQDYLTHCECYSPSHNSPLEAAYLSHVRLIAIEPMPIPITVSIGADQPVGRKKDEVH